MAEGTEPLEDTADYSVEDSSSMDFEDDASPQKEEDGSNLKAILGAGFLACCCFSTKTACEAYI